jgi:hypothetical protein
VSGRGTHFVHGATVSEMRSEEELNGCFFEGRKVTFERNGNFFERKKVTFERNGNFFEG